MRDWKNGYVWGYAGGIVATIIVSSAFGCAAIGASRALYGGGPPFHVVHPDANDDLICDRYGDILPGVTIDEALDRAREIDDHRRAHGGMP